MRTHLNVREEFGCERGCLLKKERICRHGGSVQRWRMRLDRAGGEQPITTSRPPTRSKPRLHTVGPVAQTVPRLSSHPTHTRLSSSLTERPCDISVSAHRLCGQTLRTESRNNQGRTRLSTFDTPGGVQPRDKRALSGLRTQFGVIVNR